MFKLVTVLAFVAACTARPGTYFVDVGYNDIRVTNEYGNQVNFVVDQFYGFDGPQAIQVLFQGQGIAPKTVQYFDEQGVGKGRFQSDILYQIFNDFTGPLDDIEYEKLLNLVSTYVQNGQVHPAILYALQALFGQYEALGYFDQSLQTPISRLGFLFGRSYTPYGTYGAYSKATPYGLTGLTSYYPKVGSYYSGLNSYYPGLSSYFQGLGSYFPSLNSYSPSLSSYYPSRYGYAYGSGYYGPYSNLYQSRFSWPQSFYRPYSSLAYQYGAFGAGYPQQYFGGYYGPYSSNIMNLFRGYGSNMRYQWPYLY